jgi:cytochrome P450
MRDAASVPEQPAIEYPTERTSRFDPAPELSTLREQRPMCPLRFPDGHVGWLATSYAASRAVLVDPRFSILPPRVPVDIGGLLEAITTGPESSGDMLLMDPPEHTRLRRLHTSSFTVRRVREHQGAIERIIREHLDAMAQARPPVDLVRSFALPVPAMAVCEILGVPPADHERFEAPTQVLMSGPDTSPEQKLAAMDAFYEYGRSVIAQKREHPGNDLLSELTASGELNDDELAGVAFFLFGAGHETTATALALSTFFLLEERDRWTTLVERPDLISGAVDELLRFLTIHQTGVLARTAREDVEIDGVTLKAGQSVAVSLAAANRDPARFVDPDRFDPSRDASGHFAFSFGRHLCLGQHLARLELELALIGLTSRFPSLRLAVPAEEVALRSGTHPLYGVEQLLVAW